MQSNKSFPYIVEATAPGGGTSETPLNVFGAMLAKPRLVRSMLPEHVTGFWLARTRLLSLSHTTNAPQGVLRTVPLHTHWPLITCSELEHELTHALESSVR